MMKDKKYIYMFDEGRADMRDLLGGKGANLAEMTRIGLPVPPGFTITTEACLAFLERKDEFLDEIWDDVVSAIRQLEGITGKNFGGENPLLVSVRSGAAISMPGMMDTILNLGLNDETVKMLAEESKDERFALDSYRRFIQMFGDVVLGVDVSFFENILHEIKRELGVNFDYQIPPEGLYKIIEKYKALVLQEKGFPFPKDVWEQLRMAIIAVFNSWNTPRAKTYRKINKIPDNLGTAVNVVTMVFGNLGDDCGTGVCFTRNPSTGEKELYGEFLMNAQGEDVVAGIRTPLPIKDLKEELPSAFKELVQTAELLERHYKDVQDIEFTIERGKLYILQTRNGKRTARAAVKIAVDMCEEGLISAEDAVSRVKPEQVEQLLHKQIDPEAKYEPIAKGLPASPGAAVGKVVFDADHAEKLGNSGEKVILVRPETTPDDIHGLFAAQGVLTSRGGMTSHAAVVARGLGKPCVSGCEALDISIERKEFVVNGKVVKEGDIITIDGSKGEVILGEVNLVQPSFTEDFRKLLDLADKVANLQVWANADTPQDARRARDFGAKGIGLCRTEHMFMETDRLPVMQEMIVAETLDSRKEALDKLKTMQKEDFVGIFEAMEGLPVTIRLLDPPLHEFLPKEEELEAKLEELAKEGKENTEEHKKYKKTLGRVLALKENNPMLGFRGCRLGMIYPEIYEMQISAILEAACELKAKGKRVIPQIMMPLVGTKEEMRRLKEMVERVSKEVFQKEDVEVPFTVGTMIEVPRAALVAGDIAEYAEFFSFGTNDLTQTTFGYSRDDAEGKFLAQYITDGVLPENPFHVLDREGVGRLMSIAVHDGRKRREDIKIGICGEHGGNPKSIAFCHKLELAYVSCSPFRVPVARLAAAHAALGIID
ncbi:pyruvate, phosphate dikinase [Thermovirga lienii]|jgi:pyruvate,orthophosphate dikinase|uniref:pyruvate, phosphate dikinase n=1 Tax=Thermovirga lienii TaxID=336261 RepID=UPI0026530193|nr:pyruvate, orthophosphate dikinase [Thermovirga sp.]MDN5367432.1 pyruvate, orthophosphate dikinase [Thermovirga sp.]